jgi:hypothetical protein
VQVVPVTVVERAVVVVVGEALAQYREWSQVRVRVGDAERGDDGGRVGLGVVSNMDGEGLGPE